MKNDYIDLSIEILQEKKVLPFIQWTLQKNI